MVRFSRKKRVPAELLHCNMIESTAGFRERKLFLLRRNNPTTYLPWRGMERFANAIAMGAHRRRRPPCSARARAHTPPGHWKWRSHALRFPTMRWIKNPTWDLIWVLNALWLAPLVLLLARGHEDVRASPVDALFF